MFKIINVDDDTREDLAHLGKITLNFQIMEYFLLLYEARSKKANLSEIREMIVKNRFNNMIESTITRLNKVDDADLIHNLKRLIDFRKLFIHRFLLRSEVNIPEIKSVIDNVNDLLNSCYAQIQKKISQLPKYTDDLKDGDYIFQEIFNDCDTLFKKCLQK